MTEDRKDQLREALPVAAIVLCIVIGVVLILCIAGCNSYTVNATGGATVYSNVNQERSIPFSANGNTIPVSAVPK